MLNLHLYIEPINNPTQATPPQNGKTLTQKYLPTKVIATHVVSR